MSHESPNDQLRPVGDAEMSRHTKSEKLLRKMRVSSRGIYFRRRGRSRKNIKKKIMNKRIFHREFYQDLLIFWKFTCFAPFAQNLAPMPIYFYNWWEIIHQSCLNWIPARIAVDFLQTHNFFIRFRKRSLFLYANLLGIFDTFLYPTLALIAQFSGFVRSSIKVEILTFSKEVQKKSKFVVKLLSWKSF